MSDEDADINRLFALAAERPTDETFVRAVTTRIARERRLTLAPRAALTAALVVAVIMFAGPLGQGLAVIGQAAGLLGVQFADLLAGPTGWIALSLMGLGFWLALGGGGRRSS